MSERDLIPEYAGMPRLWTLRSCLERTSFFSDPASSRYHCSYAGGLAEHSLNVERNLVKLTRKMDLVWSVPESPYIIALAHDVCKIGAYLPDGSGGYKKNPDRPKGHGDMSVETVKQWIYLTEEEEECIRWHMGAFVEDDIIEDGKEQVHKEWTLYDDAVIRFPNVLWTHTADMMATLIDEVR